MSVERYFLGWDAPATTKVCAFLLRLPSLSSADLKNKLIVVPTRQAGRRLRGALALHCAARQTAILSPQVVTPTFLLHSDNPPAHVANQAEIRAVWAETLLEIDPNEYAGVFSAHPPTQDFAWAMHTGNMIQELRSRLADGGHQIADVQRELGSLVQEPERWKDLARLEGAYLESLRELDRLDPLELMIQQAEKPRLPERIETVVMAGVPDPTPLVLQALGHLAEQISIIVLVHAPENLNDHFDSWGRPITEKWRKAQIDIPDASANIILTGSPALQSSKVLEVLAAEVGRFGPNDVALGVPDRSVSSFLAADLADRGLTTFDPAGKTPREHPVYQLLEAFWMLANDSNYAAFSGFLRQSDVLRFLQASCNVSPRNLLEDLDVFRNRYLPLALEDVTHRLFCESVNKTKNKQFADLRRATAFVQDQLDIFENNELDSALRSLLQAIYKARGIDPNDPEDEEFIAVARLVEGTLNQLADEVIAGIGLKKRNAFELLLSRLGEQSYYPERGDAVIDLEGWLELPWNDAPLLIVTGMNDGSVPDSQPSDVFLPDSLRNELGLRHDGDRLARDVYLMTELIESRREKGRACFIAGKRNNTGDPLKPSRLFFHCGDEALPERAQRLFTVPEEKRASHPSTVSFLLDVTPPADVSSDRMRLEELPVSRFKDYLECPFRFYLNHILEMEELEEKREMDPLDFGLLVHEALHKMAKSDEMRKCENSQRLRNFLCAQASKWVVRRFGSTLPLQVEIQLEAAKQRLNAAARVQGELTADGWEILESEMEIEGQFSDVAVRGRIDRIDRHRETGHIRIIDYKTSDQAQVPEKAHLGPLSSVARDYAKVKVGKGEKRWLDLQLPLYVLLLPDKEFRGRIQLGYFNLPKAIEDTKLVFWEGFDDELLQAARMCAEGVVEDIKRQRFWPPAPKVKYDRFTSLFPAEIGDCVDARAFKDFLEKSVA